MIEHVIANILLNDTTVNDYCKKNVYAIQAPDGTKCPYITITAKETPIEDNVINEFDITIEIYDYDKDKRKIRNASRHIKDLLNYITVDDPEGVYKDIRLFYRGREHIKQSDPNLSMMFISFYARGTELIQDVN